MVNVDAGCGKKESFVVRFQFRFDISAIPWANMFLTKILIDEKIMNCLKTKNQSENNF